MANLSEKKEKGLLRIFTSSKFDIFGALDYLNKTDHRGVIDYLVNQLYEFDLRDIDFMLPQICILYISWEEDKTILLRKFIIDICIRSTHLGVKIVWLLEAEAAYSSKEKRERCQTLSAICEEAIVNSKITADQFEEAVNSRARTLSTPRNPFSPAFNPPEPIPPTSPLHVDIASHEENFEENESEAVEIITINPKSNESEKKNLDIENTDEHKIEQENKKLSQKGEKNNEVSENIIQKNEKKESDANTNTNGLLSPNSVDHKVLFDLFSAKHIRSEYFNAILSLVISLNELSSALLLVQRHQRTPYLKRYISVVDNEAARGLYFPMGSVSEPHYKILRIPTIGTHALSSRDKAPFMMVLEIQYTNRFCDSKELYKVWDVKEIERRLGYARKTSEEENYEQNYGSSGIESTPNQNDSTSSLPDKDSEEKNEEQNNENSANENDVEFTKSFSSSFSLQIEDSTLERIKSSKSVFEDTWAEKVAKMKKESPFGILKDWDCMSIIFKAGDDCRQEHLAMQLIMMFDEIFTAAKLPLKLRPYNVLISSATSGIIGTVPDAISIDSLKKKVKNFVSLRQFFEDVWGEHDDYDTVKRNFVESMAAYSVVSYLLQIKDRHNGNILLDKDGHVIHIDFGFMFSNSPGGNFNWESSPFKLTKEYIEVMDGELSELFAYFRLLVMNGFLEARKYVHKIIVLVEIMAKGASLACFSGASALSDLSDRFLPNASEDECIEHVLHLIEESVDNWRSVEYDNYQRITNGIL